VEEKKVEHKVKVEIAEELPKKDYKCKHGIHFSFVILLVIW
jgi:hypothetical protein